MINIVTGGKEFWSYFKRPLKLSSNLTPVQDGVFPIYLN